MPETDVSKMKVADLKRELKLRGLSVSGNKNELQDRLQTALIDGELSLEDTAISGEDLLDGVDDAVLTDEEEAKILGADENELLKSPTSTHASITDMVIGDSKNKTEIILSETKSPPSASKKIVLKRKSSFTGISSGSITASPGIEPVATAVTINTAKENTEPSEAKASKMSERKPITVTSDTEKKSAVTKVSQLSMQERLEMRAKKFGLNMNSASAKKSDNSAATSTTHPCSKDAADEHQIEMLKKRAERFGCVVSSKIAKLDAEEKLLKRKQRFGGAGNGEKLKSNTCNEWAEKAQQRLERFKNTPSTSVNKAPN